MKYIGVPTCPYCKKRVNLIRTWSLKRQGEYRCPRCGGISNIFLSPLIYVFALLAVFAAGAVYFFHRYVLNDVELSTVVNVMVPFVLFFLISLFMVYLEKPVIKKVPKAEADGRRWKQNTPERRTAPAAAGSRRVYDDEEYLPRREYRTGAIPAVKEDDMDRTSVVKLPKTEQPAVRSALRASDTAAQARRAASASQREDGGIRRASAPGSSPRSVEASIRPVRPANHQEESAAPAAAEKPAVSTENVWEVVQPRRRTAKAGENPAASGQKAPADDFLSRYDDPEYVERRLREIDG